MPSFEEEAFARAAQLHRREDKHSEAHRPPPVKSEPAKPEPPKPQLKPKPVPAAPNLVETLFRDKDKSLILLLLMLLMDEDKDPSLLFALAYLLM